MKRLHVRVFVRRKRVCMMVGGGKECGRVVIQLILSCMVYVSTAVLIREARASVGRCRSGCGYAVVRCMCVASAGVIQPAGPPRRLTVSLCIWVIVVAGIGKN